MAKKIWYSSPLNLYWNELYDKQKKLTPNLPDQKIFEILRYNILNAPVAGNENEEQRELLLAGLEMWRQDLDQELLHIFFIDKYLRDYLADMSLSELEGVKQYLFDNGESRKVIYTKKNSKVDCVVYSFGLHIPYETDGYAFSYTIYEDNSMELFYSHGNYHGGLNDKMYWDLIKNNDKKSISLIKHFRLAINTISYMECFPECVSDGVPRITIDRKENRTSKNVILKIADKIIEIDKNKVSKKPHFRSGHFRRLQSDYYTNKKGQIIHIHQTMVKGRAKTVSTSKKLKMNEEKNNIEGI